MTNELYDLSILSEMVYGDEEFMKDLVNTFIEFAPIDTKELLDFASKKDWAETAKKAHKLKSSIRTIGIVSLEDLIVTIEFNSKNLNNIDQINSKIDSFSSGLILVIERLKTESFLN